VSMYAFRLYVAGQSERSQAAQTNLRKLCESFLPGRYELEVIDAAEDPGLAEEQRILATPTVLRLAPPPQRRVIGDLSDHRRAAYALGLSREPGSAGGTQGGDQV
jgi:circadian clock protein KaiB